MIWGMGRLPLSVIQYPSGKWGFVGSVPGELAYETSNPDYIRLAANVGAGLVRKRAEREGGFFRTRTWETQGAAVAEAERLGYEPQVGEAC